MIKKIISLCMCLPFITFPIINNTDIKKEENYIELQTNVSICNNQIIKKPEIIIEDLLYKKRQLELKKQLEQYEKKQREKKIMQQEKLDKQYKLSRSCDEVLLPHYNSNNLTELSNLTQEQIHTMLEGTRLQCLSAYYYEYEKIYKVNALFIISLTSLESGYGTSKLARTHNNLAGYRGSKSWTYFNSWHDCLNEVYRLIGQEYLSPNGRFYNGLDIKSINSKYCGDTYQWSLDINTIAHKYLKKLR